MKDVAMATDMDQVKKSRNGAEEYANKAKNNSEIMWVILLNLLQERKGRMQPHIPTMQ